MDRIHKLSTRIDNSHQQQRIRLWRIA